MSPAEVRAWREAVGLTQKECAAKLGITLRSWQRWEDGTREPPAFLVRALRDVERELVRR